MSQVQSLNTFREKHLVDITSYKGKLEGMIKTMTVQFESFDKNLKTYNAKLIENCENSIRYDMSNLSNRINELRIENNKAIFDINKMCKEINIEYDKILQIRAEVGKDFEKKVDEMKISHQDTVNGFEKFREDFSKIKSRFKEMCEFIKDVRFRRNLNEKVDKKELKVLVDNLSFKNKKQYRGEYNADTIDVESEVKNYIHNHNNNTTTNLAYDRIIKDLEEEFNPDDKKIRCDINDLKFDKEKKTAPKSSRSLRNEILKQSEYKGKLITRNVKIIDRDDSADIIKRTTINDSHKTACESDRCREKKKDSISLNKVAVADRSNSLPKIRDKITRNSNVKELMTRTTNNLTNKTYFEKIEEKEENYIKDGYESDDINSSSSKDEEKTSKNKVSVAKYDMLAKKLSETENRLLEIENNAKKKIEELATQVKVYIPINFTSHVRPNLEKHMHNNLDIIDKPNNFNEHGLFVNNHGLDMTTYIPSQTKTNRIRDIKTNRTIIDSNQKLKKIIKNSIRCNNNTNLPYLEGNRKSKNFLILDIQDETDNDPTKYVHLTSLLDIDGIQYMYDKKKK